MTSVNHLKVSDVQFNRAIEELGKFVAIPSFSNPHVPEYSMQNLMAAAEFAENGLKDLGFEVDLVRIENSAPFVVAKKIIDEALPTITLYAHYDIQPVAKERWTTDPFILQEILGRLYARGASDDKGGIMAILTALRMYQDAGVPFPVNINVLFEGEEEYGSSHMGALLKETADRLDAKALVILDGMNRDVNCGSLTSSTRGIVNISVEVRALQEKPVHSGIGCLVPDPAMSLAVLVSSLADPRKIPGFMDGFEPMGSEEEAVLAKGSQTAEEYAKEQGVVEGAFLRGDPNVSIYQRIVEEPSISIVNMTAGQPNGGNSIQDVARCSVGVRVLPGQDPNAVAKAVIDHLNAQPVLNGARATIKLEDAAWAWKANVTSGFSKLYLQALAENFPEAAATPCGGALPLIREFTERFPNMEVIVPAVEDPATSAHSDNESQDIRVLRCAINSLVSFLDKAGQVKAG